MTTLEVQLDNDVTRDMRDSTAYPMLTEQVDYASSGAPSSSGAPGASSLQRTVQGALSDVLGYKLKNGDTKGFINALNQSFQLKDVEGHTEWNWVRRSYASQVDSEMGAVTGAQQSIYTRAKVAVDQCLPLVDGLSPLDIEVMPQDIESIKTIIKNELLELVNELGTIGGPRVQRVDEILLLLLRDPEDKKFRLAATDKKKKRRQFEKFSGHVEELFNRLGFDRARINTVEDEQNYTNFLILVDYVKGLRSSWDYYRPFFTRKGAEPFLGTNLVLISRALTAVSETVGELQFALESVFLGPSEQQMLELQFIGRKTLVPWVPGDLEHPQKTNSYYFQFDDRAASLFVSEFMDWILRVTTEEAPALLQESGKDGVLAFFITVDKLRRLAHGAMINRTPYLGAQSDTDQFLPEGYKTDRVQLALQSLANQLDETARLAGEIYAKEDAAREDLPELGFKEALQDPELIALLRNAVNPPPPAAGAAGSGPAPLTGMAAKSAGPVKLTPAPAPQPPAPALSATDITALNATVNLLYEELMKLKEQIAQLK